MSTYVHSNTIGSANPKYWHFTVLDSSLVKVFNEKGKDDIASGSIVGNGANATTVWKGHQFFVFQKKFEGEYFTLKVIDTFSKKVSDFKIYPNKIIKN